jgi:SNF2 family DNA or RNA helicase
MKWFKDRAEKAEVDSCLQWVETKDGFLFELPRGQTLETHQSGLSIEDYQAQSQLFLLQELLDNGQAELTETGVLLRYKQLANLLSGEDEDSQLAIPELDLIGLPEPYPYTIEILSHSAFNLDNFKYIYRFYRVDGRQIHPERNGSLLRLGSEICYLLSGGQYALLEAIDDFNQKVSPSKNLPDTLLEFANIKGLAKETGADLDQYLNSEEVFTPQKIQLKLSETENKIEILPVPVADGMELDQDQFQQEYTKQEDVQSIYNIRREDQGRTRVVLRPKQQESLAQTKKLQQVSEEEFVEIFKAPQAYFDPEIFDLENTPEGYSFSQRVQEIGIFQKQGFHFSSPYTSEWLPDSDLGEQRKKPSDKTVSHEKENGGVLAPIATSNEEEEDYVSLLKPGRPLRYQLQAVPNISPNIKFLTHQEEGIAWLQQLCSETYTGGLLADQMGLGKTLQILSFLVWYHHQFRLKSEETKPFLIVAPVVLLENWASEYAKFFSPQDLKILTLHGKILQNLKLPPEHAEKIPIPVIQGAERLAELRRKRGSLDIPQIQKANTILTNYETVRDYQLDLAQVQWSVIVLDEAQYVKSPSTLVTNAVKAMQSDFRIACTGTPIENSMVDLWCITDFFVPGHLGSAKEFAAEYQAPLKYYSETEIRSLAKKLRNHLGDYLKRRLKEDVLEDLPPKQIAYYSTQMPPIQLESYYGCLESVQGTANQEGKKRMLAALSDLKLISDHPKLYDSQWEQIPVNTLIEQSAKLSATVKIIEKIVNLDQKVILFSDRRLTQHLLKKVVEQVFGLAKVAIVNGDTPTNITSQQSMKQSRQQVIDDFQQQKGFNAIVMSPKAAGVGLNITEANHVIHYSRWWNPAKEDQASDRVHRVGQTRDVHIYIPMAVDQEIRTFDLVLNDLLEKKRKLSNDILYPTERTEVTPTDLWETVISQVPGKAAPSTLIKIDDVDMMQPLIFEALIGAIYQKTGCHSQLTPKIDKGVDVVVEPLDQGSGLLIQCKHTRDRNRGVGVKGVQEVTAARTYYQEKLGFDCSTALVSNHQFTKEAQQLSRANQVDLQDRKWLSKMLKDYPITTADIIKSQSQERLTFN